MASSAADGGTRGGTDPTSPRPRAAVVTLPAVGAGGGDGLDGTLTTLVAAADEAAACDLPVVLAVAVETAPTAGTALVAHWQHLTAPLDAVTVLAVPVDAPGARRRATAAGLADPLTARLDPREVLVLTTTPGAVVGVDWILAHARLAGTGATAATAVVTAGDGGADRPGRPPRTQVHGANMSVRADAYLAVGGFPAVDGDEDLQLWQALLQARHRLCHALAPAVTIRVPHPSPAPG
ncbi:hypothetical protein [Kineococcus glutinatus]|uniref:Uncharacterized protein n=1 Tax=Kineococcus glutinatus TaxID=1070872 RepID=A0ABP9HHT8_9ACTN